MPQQNGDRTWTYPPLEEAMAEAGIREVETYIDHCQNTFTLYIKTSPIIGLCVAEVRHPGVRVSKRWW